MIYRFSETMPSSFCYGKTDWYTYSDYKQTQTGYGHGFFFFNQNMSLSAALNNNENARFSLSYIGYGGCITVYGIWGRTLRIYGIDGSDNIFKAKIFKYDTITSSNLHV